MQLPAVFVFFTLCPSFCAFSFLWVFPFHREHPNGNKLENNYVVYKNMFQKCGGYCQLPANRAYIKMDKVPVQGAANAPKPKAERRHIVIGNAQKPQTPTSIDNIVTDAENTAYDILGRPVDINNAVHGVYIINGQKVIK